MSEEKTNDRCVLHLPFEGREWVDADEVMFHACFAVLKLFVEKELGTEAWDFGGEESDMYRGFRLHSAGGTDEKAIDLWLWYRDELPALEKDYARDISECYSGEFEREPVGNGMFRVTSFGRVRDPKYPHDWPETVKDQKLRELIDLRRTLWT